jgi:hypothetical protein
LLVSGGKLFSTLPDIKPSFQVKNITRITHSATIFIIFSTMRSQQVFTYSTQGPKCITKYMLVVNVLVE